MRILLILMLVPILGFAQDVKSWNEIATDNYEDKNYEQAIIYYQKWLEADPSDSDAWYNLACCYALFENEDRAIYAIEKAILFGFNSCEHMKNDSDLDFINKSESFKTALNNCDIKLKAEKLTSYEEKHVIMSSIGTYGILFPENYEEAKEYPLVIWIHGSGSSESYHAKYVKEFKLEHAIVIFPRAPYIHKGVTEYNGKLGWTANQTDNLTKDDALYMEQGSLYVEWINTCIEDVKRNYNVDEKKCIIFGHSQGAAYSLAYAMKYPEKVKAAITFAGATSSKFKISSELILGLAKNEVAVELIHGVNDKMIKTDSMKELYEKLKNSKVQISLNLIEAGHSFGSSEIAKNEILRLIKKQL